MGINGKSLIVLLFIVSLLIGIESAHATAFLNLTYHKAHDNNTYFFIENAIQMPNGSYAIGIGNDDVSFYGSRFTSLLSEVYFSTEIWANTSADWGFGVLSIPVLLKFYNEDTGLRYNETWYVYKNNGFINQLDCTLGLKRCIYISNSGTSDSGGYTYVLRRSASDISKGFNLDCGLFGYDCWFFKNLNTQMYGWSYENSFGYTDGLGTTPTTLPKRMNSLVSYDQLETPTIQAGNGNTVTDYTIPFTVKFRGFYTPYDYGVAVVDNTTFATLTKAYGYTHVLTSASMVAYKTQLAITGVVNGIYYNGTISGRAYSIRDMIISDRLDVANFNTNMVNGNTYYILIFQKRFVDNANDYYYLLVGDKAFIYGGSSSGGVYQYSATYTFDMQNHKLGNAVNYSTVNLWLSIYDLDVDTLVSNGQLQADYKDAYISCTNSSSGYLINIPYSVYADMNGANRFILQADKMLSCTNSQFTLTYGSTTTVSTNADYSVAQRPELIYHYTHNGAQDSGSLLTLYDKEIYGMAMQSISGGQIIHMYYYNSTGNYEIVRNPNGYNSTNYNVKGAGYVHCTTDTTLPSTGGTWCWIYFNNTFHVWALNQIANSSSVTKTGEETSFTQLNDFTYDQAVTLTTDNSLSSFYVFVDNDYKNFKALNPLKRYECIIRYLLTNGNHEVKLTYNNVDYIHQVTASNSNATEDVAQILTCTENDLNVTTGGATYTSGSITTIVSGITTSLFGSWVVAPYIIALAITLGMLYITRNGGVGALTLIGTLFTFACMGWITGAIQYVLIGVGTLVAIFFIYTTIKPGGK